MVFLQAVTELVELAGELALLVDAIVEHLDLFSYGAILADPVTLLVETVAQIIELSRHVALAGDAVVDIADLAVDSGTELGQLRRQTGLGVDSVTKLMDFSRGSALFVQLGLERGEPSLHLALVVQLIMRLAKLIERAACLIDMTAERVELRSDRELIVAMRRAEAGFIDLNPERFKLSRNGGQGCVVGHLGAKLDERTGKIAMTVNGAAKICKLLGDRGVLVEPSIHSGQIDVDAPTQLDKLVADASRRKGCVRRADDLLIDALLKAHRHLARCTRVVLAGGQSLVDVGDASLRYGLSRELGRHLLTRGPVVVLAGGEPLGELGELGGDLREIRQNHVGLRVDLCAERFDLHSKFGLHLVDLRGLGVADRPLLDQFNLFGGRTLLFLVGGRARCQLVRAIIESFGVRLRRGKRSETHGQFVGVDAALLQQTDPVAQGRQLVGHLGLRVDLRRE